MTDNMINHINNSHKNMADLVKKNEISNWITCNHIPYSKKRYERFSKGIHTRTIYDDLVNYLVKNGYSDTIDWEN